MPTGTTVKVQRPADGREHAYEPDHDAVVLAEVAQAVVTGGDAIKRLGCRPGGRT